MSSSCLSTAAGILPSSPSCVPCHHNHRRRHHWQPVAPSDARTVSTQKMSVERKFDVQDRKASKIVQRKCQLREKLILRPKPAKLF
jgi:hypothetical protein